MDFCQPILINTCFSWLKWIIMSHFVFLKISSEPVVDSPLRVKSWSCGRQRWMIYNLVFTALIRFIAMNSDFSIHSKNLLNMYCKVQIVSSSSEFKKTPSSDNICVCCLHYVALHRCDNSMLFFFSVFIASWQTNFKGANLLHDLNPVCFCHGRNLWTKDSNTNYLQYFTKVKSPEVI